MAEARFGEASQFESFVYLTVGSGVSYCLVLDGHPCGRARQRDRGRRAPVEQRSGGLALAARAGVERAELVLSDPARASLVDEAADELGLALAVLVNALDPEAVVVGGGLGLVDRYRGALPGRLARRSSTRRRASCRSSPQRSAREAASWGPRSPPFGDPLSRWAIVDARERAPEFGEGLWVSQTPLWQTNAVLARSGSDALLCDPCYTPEEIERLVARARDGGGSIHLLLTHGDFDHTCGIGFVPEAVVVGDPTATRIASGTAEDELAAAGAEWGVTWPGGLRVDRVVEAGAFECGAFRVEAIEATGHTADGLAYVLVDQGVLLPGDYLSEMTYPFIGGGLEATIGTVRRLLARSRSMTCAGSSPGTGASSRPRRRPQSARQIWRTSRRSPARSRRRRPGLSQARRCSTSSTSSRRERRRPTSRSTGSAPRNARSVLADA